MAKSAKGKKAAPAKTAKPKGVPKKRGGAAPKAAVSRRATTLAKPSTKTKAKAASSAGTKLAPNVEEVTNAVARLSTDEKAYYTKISELHAEMSRGAVMAVYDIGAALLECKRQHPKSGADVVIQAAVGISPNNGRHYRKLAETFDRDELLGYAKMSNSKTGWTIPWTTYLSIAIRATKKKTRKEHVKTILDEQLSIDQYESRFTTVADGPEAGKTAVKLTSTSQLKKVNSLALKTRDLVSQLLTPDALKQLSSAESSANSRTIIAETIRDLEELQESTQRLRDQLVQIRESSTDEGDEEIEDEDAIDDEDIDDGLDDEDEDGEVEFY